VITKIARIIFTRKTIHTTRRILDLNTVATH